MIRAALSRAVTPLLLAAATAAAVTVSPVRAASEERVLHLGYNVYMGGLSAFAFDADVVRDGDSYRVAAKGESRGLVRLFWRWGAEAASRGGRTADGVQAETYELSSAHRGEPRFMRLEFDEPGAYSIYREPPDTPHRASKRDLPDAIPEATVDPFAMALRIADTIDRTGSCNGVTPVFDGDRRYNVTASDVGKEELSRNRHSVFAGETWRCRIAMDRISGFREEPRYVKYWDEDEREPPHVWFARLAPDMPPVPVRLTVDLNMGVLIVYLVRAEYENSPVLGEPKRPALQQARSR